MQWYFVFSIYGYKLSSSIRYVGWVNIDNVTTTSVCEIISKTWDDILSGDNEVWKEISRFTRTL